MGQNEEEAASENRTLVVVLLGGGRARCCCPLVHLDVLEDKVDIKAPLKFHFELFLHFADDADQVEESVLDLDALRRDLPLKVLLEDLLDEGIAR